MYLKLPPRTGARGPFQPVRAGSKFYRQWVLANGGDKPFRRDRMPLSIFRNRLFRARLHTVTTVRDPETRQTKDLPKALHYSIVSEFLP